MEKKRRDFERKVVEEALSVEDVLLFSSGGDLFGISSLKELQNDCCLFIYLFVRREIGYFEMMDEMGRERITRNY